MARDHARIQTRIWVDKDFRSLTRDGQHMYFTVLSQPSLSYCGVMDFWPTRLATLCNGGNEQDVYGALKELLDADYVDLDAETHELMVRSYIRHDRVLERVNMGKAVGRALERVTSLHLRDAVLKELARLYKTDPQLLGFQGLRDLYPDEFELAKSMALGM